jgi:anti-sigma B factor antagonist
MTSQLLVATRGLEPDITVVSLSGKIVMGPDSQGLETLVSELVGKGARKVVLDCAGLTFLDSSGLGAIARCFVVIQRAGGGLRLAGVSQRVMNALKVTRLNDVVPCYPSVADAARDFQVQRKPGDAFW